MSVSPVWFAYYPATTLYECQLAKFNVFTSDDAHQLGAPGTDYPGNAKNLTAAHTKYTCFYL